MVKWRHRRIRLMHEFFSFMLNFQFLNKNIIKRQKDKDLCENVNFIIKPFAHFYL